MFVEFRNLEFLRASFGCCKLGPVQTSHALRVSSNLVFSALGLAERLSEGFALFHKSLLIWPFSSKIEKVLENFENFVRHRRISQQTEINFLARKELESTLELNDLLSLFTIALLLTPKAEGSLS